MNSTPVSLGPAVLVGALVCNSGGVGSPLDGDGFRQPEKCMPPEKELAPVMVSQQ